MANFFPSPTLPLINDLWFKVDPRINDDIDLTKEENEFYEKMQKELNKGQDIVPIGKSKEQNVEADVDEDDAEEEDSAEEELEVDTDEFDTPSPDLVSMDDEVEMGDSSNQNADSGECSALITRCYKTREDGVKASSIWKRFMWSGQSLLALAISSTDKEGSLVAVKVSLRRNLNSFARILQKI
eukprot:gene7125-7930_t